MKCYFLPFLLVCACNFFIYTSAFHKVPLDRTRISIPGNSFKKSLVASVIGALIFYNPLEQSAPCIAASYGIPDDSIKSYPVESLTLNAAESIDVNSARIQTYQKIPGAKSF